MGSFEKLSVLVIVVIIVMILVVALYTWTGDPSGTETAVANVPRESVAEPAKLNGIVIDPKANKFDWERRAAPRPKTQEEILKELIDPRKTVSVPGMDEPTPGNDEPKLDEIKPIVKEPRFHVVVPGDTIARIAKAHYPGAGQKAIDAVLKANPTVDPSRMSLGYKLLLPELGTDVKVADLGGRGTPPPAPAPVVASIRPGSVYVTKKTDTLKGLAQRAYRDVNQWHRIWVENYDEINDPDHLQGGVRLRIPVL